MDYNKIIEVWIFLENLLEPTLTAPPPLMSQPVLMKSFGLEIFNFRLNKASLEVKAILNQSLGADMSPQSQHDHLLK